MPRQAAVTVRAPGASIAPKSKPWAWRHTRGENRGANGANTRRIAPGRGGMAVLLRSHDLWGKLISRMARPALLPTPKGQSRVYHEPSILGPNIARSIIVQIK